VSESIAAVGPELAARAVRRPPPSLDAAVGEFEAYLIGELLRMATRSSGDALLDGGSAGRTYRELFYQEIGRIAAERGGLGLAGSLRGSRPAPEGADARRAER
jgi:Rod binding domain-containing protein